MSRSLCIVAASFMMTAAACSRDRPIEPEVSATRTTSASVGASDVNGNSAGAKESKANATDRNGAPVTAVDLENANDPADRDLIEQLRGAIVDDDTLSSTSKAVTIVVHGGVVTLSGPVRNVREHDAILNKARVLAGTSKVIDEVDVQTP